MRRFFVAFLLLNVAAINLASAKTVVLTDNENSNIAAYTNQQATSVSSEDSDVINFCRMCKSYVTLFQQADDTVEVRMPLEDLCDDVEENDQTLCLESINNLNRLSSFDDLSTVDNLEVCQLMSLCDEMLEEDEVANGSDEVIESGSQQIMETGDGLNGLNGAHGAHGINGGKGANGANGGHAPLFPPVGNGVHGDVHGGNGLSGHHVHIHSPQHSGPGNSHVHNGHAHNGHSHKGNDHHKKHNGASSNAVISSTLLLVISIFLGKNFSSA